MLKNTFFIIFSCLFSFTVYPNKENPVKYTDMETNVKYDTATFGGGCFWCIEAVFEQIKGVNKVISGYAGGTTKNPTYEQVCSGTTGHAEVCQIIFDPEIISYPELLLIFFSSHDPTSLNRQGADAGTQYRSVIFYHNPQQKIQIENTIKVMTEQKLFENSIKTQVVPYTIFYQAENYHQNYYANNSGKGYCTVVINPKLAKIRTYFSKYLK